MVDRAQARVWHQGGIAFDFQHAVMGGARGRAWSVRKEAAYRATQRMDTRAIEAPEGGAGNPPPPFKNQHNEWEQICLHLRRR